MLWAYDPAMMPMLAYSCDFSSSACCSADCVASLCSRSLRSASSCLRSASTICFCAAILRRFRAYGRKRDFVGMGMARKFLQMGYTRARRYANRRSGRKYAEDRLLPRAPDPVKAQAAQIFYLAWRAAVFRAAPR